ncbi:unnamed protein product, partial [Symbiodinium necroappetens]
HLAKGACPGLKWSSQYPHRPPLTLFSRRASSSEPLRPREPPYPPPVRDDAGEEEVVEVEVEAEGETTSVIPQPATPEEVVPETPPPLPPAAALDVQEAEPMSAGVDISEAKEPIRHHLPPKPKIRPQPSPSPTVAVPVAMPQQEKTLPNRDNVEMDPLRAPTTVRIKGSIGRQLASRARSMGLQSAVKSKAKPLRIQPKGGSMPSTPAATVDEDATTTAISGIPSSGSTPHTAEPGTARTEARETAANDLPAPVLVYPSLDGTLAELGPLYRREATASDAATGTEGPAEWQVEVDGVRRPLPAMPEWIREVLAHRPTPAAPLTAAPVRDGREPRAGPPHGARASDSNSGTSIAVTRVKRSRSFSPARSSPAVNLSAGAEAEAEPMDKTGHEKTSKKANKKDAKKKEKKKKTKRSSRRKHRRRRSSKSPTSDCEDMAPTAADTDIREEASSRHPPPEGTEAAADPKPAVQPVASALTPTSPAEGHPSLDRAEVGLRKQPLVPLQVALLCSPMANKDHTADQATTAPTGTGDQPITTPPTLPTITVSPLDQSSPTTSTPSTVVVKNRKRSGQARRTTTPESTTPEISSSSGWLPEDDTLLNIGGREELPSVPSSTALGRYNAAVRKEKVCYAPSDGPTSYRPERRSVLVLNASSTILWPHATFSLTRA